MMNATNRDQVFISYSHVDTRWFKKLMVALRPLIDAKKIDVWADTRIKAGQKWKEQITEALARAKVAVLLVSQEFLASDFIVHHELPAILDAAEAQGLTIMWIPVTCSFVDETDIAEYQAAHDPSRPLEGLRRDLLHRALTAIGRKIKGACEQTVEGSILKLKSDGCECRLRSRQDVLYHLERALGFGELKDSELGPLVLQTLQRESALEIANPVDWRWMTTGIRLGDVFFTLIRPSAGQRDWQRDLAQMATPILVGVAKSLQRSPDAQAVIVRLCEVLAQRLRLRISWPDDPDKLNDVRNSIYRACLASREIESDDVLTLVQALTVVGPG